MKYSWKIVAVALSLVAAASSVACGGASEPVAGESEDTINAPLQGANGGISNPIGGPINGDPSPPNSGDNGGISNPIGGPITGDPPPPNSGDVTTGTGSTSGPGAFALCERNKCPAQIPQLARVCDDGSTGVPECVKYRNKKRCEWTFVCGL